MSVTVQPSKDVVRQRVVEVQGLTLHFGSNEILKGIDLRVHERELVFLLGPSGSGKSTLLRCLNRLEKPTSGLINVAGYDLLSPLTDLNVARRHIGMVFQSFNLYPHMTALANVTLALRRVMKQSKAEANAVAMEALEKVGLADKAHLYPRQLSGGQQQRVAIARAVALRPAIMLFDEPTSALDPELVGSVLSVMQDLRDSGMTMLVVSHEMSFARKAADRIVFMADGELLEQAPPEQFFTSPQHERAQRFLREFGSR